MFHVEPRGERVALLRMDDGKVNAIGLDFVSRFADAWTRAAHGERAVVIAGNAKAFSAGLDLKRLPQLERTDLLRFSRSFASLFAQVLAHERPVVAAVDGPALAGGAVLALCADFRLVTPNARLGLTEVPIGVPFPAPIAQLGRARLPPQEHAPALLAGAIRSGEECVRHGWAHERVASDAVESRAVALAQELAAHPSAAYAAAKRALNEELARGLDAFVKEKAAAWTDEVAAQMEAILEGFARATAKR